MRTIEAFEDYADPIQEAIDDLLLPTLFGQTDPLPSDLRRLVTLKVAFLLANLNPDFAIEKSIFFSFKD